MLLTHALVLSADQFYAKKSPYDYVHSVKIEIAKLNFSRHEDNLPTHRARDAGCVYKIRTIIAPVRVSFISKGTYTYNMYQVHV